MRKQPLKNAKDQENPYLYIDEGNSTDGMDAYYSKPSSPPPMSTPPQNPSEEEHTPYENYMTPPATEAEGSEDFAMPPEQSGSVPLPPEEEPPKKSMFSGKKKKPEKEDTHLEKMLQDVVSNTAKAKRTEGAKKIIGGVIAVCLILALVVGGYLFLKKARIRENVEIKNSDKVLEIEGRINDKFKETKAPTEKATKPSESLVISKKSEEKLVPRLILDEEKEAIKGVKVVFTIDPNGGSLTYDGHEGSRLVYDMPPKEMIEDKYFPLVSVFSGYTSDGKVRVGNEEMSYEDLKKKSFEMETEVQMILEKEPEPTETEPTEPEPTEPEPTETEPTEPEPTEPEPTEKKSISIGEKESLPTSPVPSESTEETSAPKTYYPISTSFGRNSVYLGSLDYLSADARNGLIQRFNSNGILDLAVYYLPSAEQGYSSDPNLDSSALTAPVLKDELELKIAYELSERTSGMSSSTGNIHPGAGYNDGTLTAISVENAGNGLYRVVYEVYFSGENGSQTRSQEFYIKSSKEKGLETLSGGSTGGMTQQPNVAPPEALPKPSIEPPASLGEGILPPPELPR